MTDEQDISIALLQEKVINLQNKLDEISEVAYKLRDDRLRIEGGRWVLWFLGGSVLALIGAWYSITNSAPIQSLFGLHGGG